MDKRSLFARIVKAYPAIQEMITGESKKDDHTFLVSWVSLERRQVEYQDLVEKRVPANIKDIALARSYGDLRENHEYKSAKEMQRVLQRRKAELERELGRARGTDFASVRTDIVGPGTTIKITDLETGGEEIYDIVGAWDGDPDKNRVSYLTPFAKSFVGHPAGAEVSFTTEGATRRFSINSIQPYQAAA